jgi:uncharacterized membrane protein
MSGRKGKNKNQGSSQSENDSGNKGLSNQHASEQINVSDTERHFSMIGGTVLVVCGLLRGSLSGLALVAIGGGLIYRGQTGHCHLYEAMEFSSVEDEQKKVSGGQDHGRDDHQDTRKIHASA